MKNLESKKEKIIFYLKLLLVSSIGIYLGIAVDSFLYGVVSDYYFPLAFNLSIGAIFIVPIALGIFLLAFSVYCYFLEKRLEYINWSVFFTSFFGCVIGGQIAQYNDFILGNRSDFDIKLLASFVLGLFISFILFRLSKKFVENINFLKTFILSASIIVALSAIFINIFALESSHDLCNKISIGTSLERVMEIISVYHEQENHSVGDKYFYIQDENTVMNSRYAERHIWLNSGGSSCMIFINDNKVSDKELQQDSL